MRSNPCRALLVIAALVGLVVSSASWAFLELVHELQVWVYEDLPGELGFASQPVWWLLPWLALAGVVTALAITRLPGVAATFPPKGSRPVASRPHHASFRESSSLRPRPSASGSYSGREHRSSPSARDWECSR